jgi:ketosteroid isomerase-like protein
MSEESTTPGPVELTRRSVEAADRGDLDGILRTYAPDAVWDMNPLGGLGTFEGHPAIRRFLEDWHGNYEELEFAPEEILDLGNGVIFSVIAQKGRPVGSSGDVQLRHTIVFVWAEGLFVRITHYGDIDEGRAAAERLAEERG